MSCQFDNYAPRAIHKTGLKVRPYTWIGNKGLVYANGQTFAFSQSDAIQPSIDSALTVSTPSCRNC